MGASACQRQIANAGKAKRSRTSNSNIKPRHLGDTPGQNCGFCIVTQPQPDRTASGNGNDIFHGAANGNANRIIIAIKAQIAVGKALLYRVNKGGCLRGNGQGGWQAG